MTDEVKLYVEICREWYQAFTNFGRGDERSVKDLLVIGNMIESLAAELERVKLERDAAVEDLETMGEARPYCGLCAHEKVGIDEAPCGTCREGYIENNWQWRGVQKEE